MRLIMRLVREERPLEFFTVIAALLALLSIALAVPVIAEYLQTASCRDCQPQSCRPASYS